MPIKITLAPEGSAIPIEVIGENPQSAWRQASQMTDIAQVRKCGNAECGSPELKPEVREVEHEGKTFDSYKIRCRICGSTIKLGLNKVGGGMFLKWDEKWFIPEKKADQPPI